MIGSYTGTQYLKDENLNMIPKGDNHSGYRSRRRRAWNMLGLAIGLTQFLIESTEKHSRRSQKEGPEDSHERKGEKQAKEKGKRRARVL
jgi:hypothetical protein